MFSCLSRIDSLDSPEAFRLNKQQMKHKQTTTTTAKGVIRATTNRQLVIFLLLRLPSFFESHAPVVQFLSSPQHCPVEQSPFA